VLSPAGLAPTAGASAAPAAPAAPRPTPTSTTKTLPVPKATVDPRVSIGGEQLASMGMIVDRPAGVPAPPRLQDVAWLLADLDTGEVIAAKGPHARLLPASTLKTLTALTLIPEVPATQRITATREDASADGTRVGILPGQTYTGEQLFQALLMSSGNDAAYALARAGGGRKATVDAMNAQAARLGAHDTVAVDPSGLDAPGQRSSAYDLALIGRAAMRLPEFRRYVTTKQVAFPGAIDPKTKKRSTFVIGNHNRLLYNYEGTLGIKNGFTKAAQRTFISAVRRGGKTYLLTEMYGLNSSWRPQAAMYDWAFAHGSKVTPVGRLVEPGEVPEPPVLPSASAGPAALTTSAARAEPHGTAQAAAAAVTEPRQLSAALPPWAGLAGLAGTLGLVGALATRAIRRAPRRH
jgi:serine-type D-Ala-D-Ala carboxypeptidase (penicillin-binding protein 5/6)